MRKVSAGDVDGELWSEIDGRDEGGGGEGRSWSDGGERPVIRRRLRGGGLTSGDGIVLSFYRSIVYDDDGGWVKNDGAR